MDLHINQLIIHELEKEVEASEANVFLTEELIPVDERAALLVTKLNAAFIGKGDILQGYLNRPEDALFPGYFQDLVDKQFEESAFVDFSKNTMNALQLALQGVVGAKGGYLVYADYTQFDARILGIFLVRDTEGVIFKKDTAESTFNLDAITYLNTDKLAMACRIHINRFQNSKDRFVDLIKHAKSQKAISEYFINWIGMERQESSKQLTNTFLEVVNHLPLPVDEETGSAIQEGEFREKVMNFAISSPEKTLRIDDFDRHFYQEQGTTQQYLLDNEIALDNEFHFDTGQFKKHYNCRISAEGIALNFNRSHLSNYIVEVEGDSIVIRSPALVEKLRGVLD